MLQGCQADPQGRFCSFPSLHAPEEDSEVTWQPGKFLPLPSEPVALACPKGVCFWDQLMGRKQAGLYVWMSSQALGTGP